MVLIRLKTPASVGVFFVWKYILLEWCHETLCRGDQWSPKTESSGRHHDILQKPPLRRLRRQLPSSGALRKLSYPEKPLLEERCHDSDGVVANHTI